MDIITLIDLFEEVETTEEYNGYFSSIAEVIIIVVLVQRILSNWQFDAEYFPDSATPQAST